MQGRHRYIGLLMKALEATRWRQGSPVISTNRVRQLLHNGNDGIRGGGGETSHRLCAFSTCRKGVNATTLLPALSLSLPAWPPPVKPSLFSIATTLVEVAQELPSMFTKMPPYHAMTYSMLGRNGRIAPPPLHRRKILPRRRSGVEEFATLDA
jgi:hypothetical protein